MKTTIRALIAFILLLVFAIASYYGWLYFMEPVRQKMWFSSEAAERDPLLAANKFLSAEGFSVQSHTVLDSGLIGQLDAGVLLIAEGHSVSSYDDYDRLLQWVEQGGVLITLAEWNPGEDDERVTPMLGDDFDTWQEYLADEDEHDKNAELHDDADPDEAEKKVDEIKEAVKERIELPCEISLPVHDHVLKVAKTSSGLIVGDEAGESYWPDDVCRQQRVYEYGNGFVVFLSHMPFDNHSMRLFDHAEWLLTLANLQTQNKKIALVQHFDMPPWYVWLWRHFSLVLIVIAVGIVLLVWRHLPRFGPLQPAFAIERRALLEHIDASARWLWRDQAGRERLLAILRQRVIKQLVQKRPQFSSLSGDELHAAIAQWTAIPVRDVQLALSAAVAKDAITFTRQVHLLQRLRTHHD